MEKINLELAQQHKLIVEKCDDLLKVLQIEDKDIINSIMNKSKLQIEKYNQENSTIVDANKIEIGFFNGMVKKIISKKYITPSVNLFFKPKSRDFFDYLCDKEELQFDEWQGEPCEYYDYNLFCKTCKKEYFDRDKLLDEYYLKINSIKEEFKTACDNTIFPDDLIKRSVSLSRSIIIKYDPTELQKILKKEIHKEALIVFEEQNKDLLKKYNF